MEERIPIKLTQFSHGAGCGCKIAPGVLEQILSGLPVENHPNLLVGYENKDDAAVYDLGNGTAIISTTDFFMPIVDDAFQFGRIASVNAISDVFAMGGTPLLAIGILGWPVDKIDTYWAGVVLEGAKSVCKEAGIPLAGGHSIDCPEPVFGLAVTGLVAIPNLKTNAGARPGDILFLTKGLGVGILTTAEKKGMLMEEHKEVAIQSMLRLNAVGARLSQISGVHAMTDVTGFGLAGHLLELCEGSGCNALVHYVKLPLLEGQLAHYLEQQAIPGGTHRNWKSYGQKLQLADETWKYILADPQTSGGLLIAVAPESAPVVREILNQENLYNEPIGKILQKEQLAATRESVKVDKRIIVE
ncbi:MAG: selenide, water dikinase SelD [Saprospiraceae bacterium]|nr:selenide, water dikinase SelD [Saprospiraceae bacterium]